jgi:signal transduction histidine kinase/ActR/RegA family two-component response regulator
MADTSAASATDPPAADAGTRADTARQRAILQTGALQGAMLRSANFSCIATDERGVIQVFNVGAQRMLGYAPDDVLNRITPADVSDPEEIVQRAQAMSAEFGVPITPGLESLVFKASRGIEDVTELTYLRKDGSRLPAVVSVTALRDAHDGIIGYLLIGTDNTARKRVEAERQELDRRLGEVVQRNHGDLQDARIAADKANQAKSDFLSSMSHELRSPLNAILGFAQLMDSGTPPPTPDQKDSIDQILQAGWYLLALINEILDLSLIESGKLSLSTEPMGLAEVLADCRAMIEPQARKSGIELQFAAVGLPLFVNADRTRVKQVFVNLLSNAIKYNRPGGTVALTCTLVGPRVRISVRDTGHGLSPEKLSQLFQPFNRLGQESGVEEGTGIGLVVSKRLVELMHGEIGAHSTLGVGSVFWVELDAAVAPQIADAADEVLAQAAEPAPDGDADAPRRTVLCVEDNPANLLLVARLLERRGDLRLISAKDGGSGVEMARTVQPDIILMDINLPGISGVTAMQILAGDLATAHIPVIALSANAMPHDVERGLALGFFRYLTKPIKLAEFLRTLDQALDHADGTKARMKEPS